MLYSHGEGSEKQGYISYRSEAVTDAIIINGPDCMIIGLGSKGLSWKELLSYIYM